MATKVNVEDSRILREVIDRAYHRGCPGDHGSLSRCEHSDLIGIG